MHAKCRYILFLKIFGLISNHRLGLKPKRTARAQLSCVVVKVRIANLEPEFFDLQSSPDVF
jgi:hypothetical protein